MNSCRAEKITGAGLQQYCTPQELLPLEIEFELAGRLGRMLQRPDNSSSLLIN